MHLCIFNPEHDLCLAKGRATYVPPQSAIEFARGSANIMQSLYPGTTCCPVYDFRHDGNILSIVAWGWNATVKYQLLKRGVPEELLPDDNSINTIRRLQHRQTMLPLQSGYCWVAHNEDNVVDLLNTYNNIVLKAPWSGAGRGLRWIHGPLTRIDRDWIAKTVSSQGCVMVEKRHDVEANCALEYVANTLGLHFVGYSLFHTENGVYKTNAALTDTAIEQYINGKTGELAQTRRRVEHWLTTNIVPHYHGPIGIDLIVGRDRNIYVAEMNLRHTMGMVAHSRNNNKPLLS